jgi:hypothetical protein
MTDTAAPMQTRRAKRLASADDSARKRPAEEPVVAVPAVEPVFVAAVESVPPIATCERGCTVTGPIPNVYDELLDYLRDELPVKAAIGPYSYFFSHAGLVVVAVDRTNRELSFRTRSATTHCDRNSAIVALGDGGFALLLTIEGADYSTIEIFPPPGPMSRKIRYVASKTAKIHVPHQAHWPGVGGYKPAFAASPDSQMFWVSMPKLNALSGHGTDEVHGYSRDGACTLKFTCEARVDALCARNHAVYALLGNKTVAIQQLDGLFPSPRNPMLSYRCAVPLLGIAQRLFLYGDDAFGVFGHHELEVHTVPRAIAEPATVSRKTHVGLCHASFDYPLCVASDQTTGFVTAVIAP